ncbi:MAG: hypothetical protein AAF442_06025 [Pseudomonadota bacterium]
MMMLNIRTFSNQVGGDPFFKAVGHPLVTPAIRQKLTSLPGPMAVVDPLGHFESFAALFDVEGLQITGVFVPQFEKIGETVAGFTAQSISDLPGVSVRHVFVCAYDAGRHIAALKPWLADDTSVLSLDEFRLPEAMLTNPRAYLNPLNFAVNQAFFRDEGGAHTRIVTGNYWGSYGAKNPRLWLRLFDKDGHDIATWQETLPPPGGTVILDSKEIRERLSLPAFTGQLFIHVLGAAGHDIVKYALDTYGDEASELSCTHDANAWPANFYAGLPAAQEGEKVVLWVQNSHPCPIPAEGLGVSLMGSTDVKWLDSPLDPFATRALDLAELFSDAAFPAQFEVHAGKYVTRPRYEITKANGRRRIAHTNVEREDLQPDPHLAQASDHIGKGYIMVAPIMPVDRFDTIALPTPMARGQQNMPLALVIYDAQGREALRKPLGCLPRNHQLSLDMGALLAKERVRLAGGRGHAELVYDFSQGGGDGWLHAIFRYDDRTSGHSAETSFGSHMFNMLATYKNEPQSYTGPPPGLSTRLFLRSGMRAEDRSFCYLIYPVSRPWHETSTTELQLFDAKGEQVDASPLKIPQSGSHLFFIDEVFADAVSVAGADHYVIIRDTTCRLFGYHGLMNGQTSFSLDHMFGF